MSFYSTSTKVRRLQDIRSEQVSLGRGAVANARKHAETLQAIKEKWDLTEDSRTKGRNLAWESYAAKSNDDLYRFRELEKEFAKVLAEVTAPHIQPGGSLEEARRQAAWTRLEKDLDAGAALNPKSLRMADADKRLRDAAEVGDVATMEAGRRELPSYLKRHNEMMPPGLAVWLDIQVGPPDAADARTVELSKGKDHTAAYMALGTAASAGQNRIVPDVMGDPNGIEGGRVAYIVEQTSR